MKAKQLKPLILLPLLFFVLALTGCTQETPETTSETIRLQWWGVFLSEDVVQPLIEEYQNANNGVEILYRDKWPGGESTVATKLYQEELERVLKNNDPTGGGDESLAVPDIFMVQNTWAGKYEAYTRSAPSTVLTADTVKTAYYAAVAEDFAQGDVVRGLPLWMDSLAVIYNKKILATAAASAPPTNWADFKNLALTLTKKSNSVITQAGFAAGTSTNVSFAPELLNLLLLQNGVDMLDGSGNPIFSIDSDSVTALDFYQSFAKSTGTWNDDLKNDSLAFLEGDVAMIVAPSWRLYDILKFNDIYDLGLEIGVAPIPQLSGQVSTYNWATYWGAMVALNRPNGDAAWKFVNWLSQPEQLRKIRDNQTKENEFSGILYPRIDMQGDLASDTWLKVYNASLPSAQSWYMVDGVAVRDVMMQLIDSSGGNSAVASAENSIQTIISSKGLLD